MATTSQQKKWEQLTLERIAEADAITYLGAKHPSLQAHEHPNFKVYEFTPNKALDGKERYYLSGPEHSIMLQSSLLKAQHDIFAARMGFGNPFDEWFKEFSEGYTSYKRGIKTNYPATGETPWRKDLETRPKYAEWVAKTPIEGQRVIEYFPQGFEGRSIILSGSDWELKRYIQFIEFEGGGTATVEEEEEGQALPEKRGKIKNPHVILYFKQRKAEVKTGVKPKRARLTIHLLKFTDDPRKTRADIRLIAKSDIQKLIDKIKFLFCSTTEGYKYNAGKLTGTYMNTEQGYHLWTYFKSKTEAKDLFKTILQINDDVMDLRNLFYGECDAAQFAYPEENETIPFMGEQKKVLTRRKNATMLFDKASLVFPTYGTRHTLLENIYGNWIIGPSTQELLK